MIDHDAIAERRYDALDDQGVLNPAEIRAITGLEAEGDFSAAAIRDRLGIVTIGVETEEETVTDPEQRKSTLAQKAGAISCGDCLVEVPAGTTCRGGHLTNPRKGKVRVNG